MCHSFKRDKLEKWCMGRMFCLIIYHITDSRNELGDHHLNRSFCYICMDRDDDTENDKEVEKLEINSYSTCLIGF